MKKVLITGANSYIGTSFEKYILDNYKDDFIIDTLDMKNDCWKNSNFSDYDSIFHVAGIAHVDVTKIDESQKQLYYTVNCDLAVETAKKAVKDGVRQFIYMSSILVYGNQKNISFETNPNPFNFYGDSKLKAEKELSVLEDLINIVILRPPMIYGENCKGNFQSLIKISKISPLFPNYNNQRSILYIHNLCEVVKEIIIQNERGTFFPQNNEYISTTEIVKTLNSRIVTTKLFNPIIDLLKMNNGKIGRISNKAFGNMIYDKEMSKDLFCYNKYDFKSSVERIKYEK